MSVTKIRPGAYKVKVYQRVDKPGARPKPIIRTVSGHDEARCVEKDLQELRDVGGKVGRTTTVAQYADTWIAGKESEDLAAQTLRNYREMLARYVLPGIGDIRLLTLRADHIRKLYSDLKARGLSGTTRLTAHRSLRAMLNTAAADGSIRRNPIKSVKAPQDDTLEKDALDPDQVVDFLAALDGSTVHGPVVVMLAAGLRRQELLALRWESVDLDVGTIAVAVKGAEVEAQQEARPHRPGCHRRSQGAPVATEARPPEVRQQVARRRARLPLRDL